MRMVIDRFEGVLAVCVTEDKFVLSVERNKLPIGVVEGSMIEDTSNGYVLVDNEGLNLNIQEKMKKVFK